MGTGQIIFVVVKSSVTLADGEGLTIEEGLDSLKGDSRFFNISGTGS